MDLWLLQEDWRGIGVAMGTNSGYKRVGGGILPTWSALASDTYVAKRNSFDLKSRLEVCMRRDGTTD